MSVIEPVTLTGTIQVTCFRWYWSTIEQRRELTNGPDAGHKPAKLVVALVRGSKGFSANVTAQEWTVRMLAEDFTVQEEEVKLVHKVRVDQGDKSFEDQGWRYRSDLDNSGAPYEYLTLDGKYINRYAARGEYGVWLGPSLQSWDNWQSAQVSITHQYRRYARAELEIKNSGFRLYLDEPSQEAAHKLAAEHKTIGSRPIAWPE